MVTNFVFTHVHRCVLALFTQYFPKLCEKEITYYSGGIQTHDLCKSRAVSLPTRPPRLTGSWYRNDLTDGSLHRGYRITYVPEVRILQIYCGFIIKYWNYSSC